MAPRTVNERRSSGEGCDTESDSGHAGSIHLADQSESESKPSVVDANVAESAPICTW